MSNISEQQKLFVEEYLKLRCKNATQAAINAGYSEKSASSKASQLIKNDKVLELLEQRKNEIKSELQQEFIFDALTARRVMYDVLNDVGATDRDKITVAKDFLDRAGFKPENMVNVNLKGEVNNPFKGLTTEQLIKLADDD